MKKRPLRSPMSMITGSSMPISVPRHAVIESSQLERCSPRRLMPAPIEPQHSIMIESEYLALASGAEQLITTSAERRQQVRFAFVITIWCHTDLAMLPLRGSSRSGPIELGQCQVTCSVLVELVCDRVHRPSWRVDMYVGQSVAPAARGPAR